MSIKVDASDAIKQTNALIKELDDLPTFITRRVERAVARERNSHKYQNRTHAAETNTISYVQSGAGFEIIAEMGVDYSSYLNLRGFSKFDELVGEAFDEVKAHMGRLGRTK